MTHRITGILALVLLIGCGGGGPVVEAPSKDILTAAAEGDSETIEAHVNAGTDLNQKEPVGGSTPLIIAASLGHTETVLTLISNGADIEQVNNEGSTALLSAVFFCHLDTVKALVEAGADVNKANNAGNHPLDAVEAEWSQEIEGIYNLVAGITQMEIDMERIKQERGAVAAYLKENGATTSFQA